MLAVPLVGFWAGCVPETLAVLVPPAQGLGVDVLTTAYASARVANVPEIPNEITFSLLFSFGVFPYFRCPCVCCSRPGVNGIHQVATTSTFARASGFFSHAPLRNSPSSTEVFRVPCVNCWTCASTQQHGPDTATWNAEFLLYAGCFLVGRSWLSHTLTLGRCSVLCWQDLRDAFYSFGELRSIRIVPGKDFAFVQFTTRQAAEAAAEQLYKVRSTALSLVRGMVQQADSTNVFGARSGENLTWTFGVDYLTTADKNLAL